MSRFLCIHAHFYQPPRENPWTGMIDRQPSAHPYHDWNQRILDECYRPNGNSKILDSQGTKIRSLNHYSMISYNFGPTLLQWIEDHDPITYERIISGDRISLERFGGHGSAIGQAYNHMILPLANARDKETQIIWGIRDFEARFKRPPESLWLPETAVDTQTLEILSAYGMKYVILAPRQAAKTRSLVEDEPWKDVIHERVDSNRPYLIQLPSGRKIAAFFYHGSISRAVAFEGLLHDGRNLAHRLVSAFQAVHGVPQLVHIATDGESYGHHHRHGEMALSSALHEIETHGMAKLINYGEFLDLHPPTHEVQIVENSSWSCFHGVERWMSDCGCNTGMKPEWRQKWRSPLRVALNHLRDRLAKLTEAVAAEIGFDPWLARNKYIEVLLDRQSTLEVPMRLMEIQKYCLFMYTSCAWFFDEVSGIETLQNLRYARRALELAAELTEEPLEREFLVLLKLAPSNLPEVRDASRLYSNCLLSGTARD